jgi:hypothetical protein
MTKRSSETTNERLARYIRNADEARDLAARTKRLDRREECLSVAESWLAMAHGTQGKPVADGADTGQANGTDATREADSREKTARTGADDAGASPTD